MISKSTILHLRFPFSFFLLPIFLFASFQSGEFNTSSFWLLFIALHLFVYPASNGFNSFYDKDEGSIGGLKNPPKVKADLLVAANILDLLGLILSFYLSSWTGIGVALYILVSRAYSFPAIRLKKYPVVGLLSVSIFQGYVVFIITILTLNDMNLQELSWLDHFGGIISSLFLFGSYPMTQIYQHEQDMLSGDKTISMLLGIKGTFVFTGLFFGLTMALFYFYFSFAGYPSLFPLLLFFLLPVFIFFSLWQFNVFFRGRDPDFVQTMRLNFLSSLCLNCFFAFAILFA